MPFDASFWTGTIATLVVTGIFSIIYDLMLRSMTVGLRRTLTELGKVNSELATLLTQEYADTPNKLKVFIAPGLRRRAREGLWRATEAAREERFADEAEQASSPPRGRGDSADLADGAAASDPEHSSAVRSPDLMAERGQPSRDDSPSAVAVLPAPLESVESAPPGAVRPTVRPGLVSHLAKIINRFATRIGGELGEAASEAAVRRSGNRPFVALAEAMTNVFGMVRARAEEISHRWQLDLFDLGYRAADRVLASPVLSGAATGVVVAIPLALIASWFGFVLAVGWAVPATIGGEYGRRVARRRWGKRFWIPARNRNEGGRDGADGAG